MADTGPRYQQETLAPGTRMACRIEYDGGRYSGWQSQPHLEVLTVQEELERALSNVADSPLRVHCAGRTDTGVHGLGQVVHFDAPAPRSEKAWVMGGNANLPPDIRIHWAIPVPADFHARFSARSRSYRYLIANTPVRPALMSQQLTWYRFPLDAQRMHQSARCLLGERDFSAFRAAGCQSSSPMRNVQSLKVYRRGELVVLDIRANAFLHHMVRNIAGTLMAVGSGRIPSTRVAQLMQEGDRRQAPDTAPAAGLYLLAVEYPERFGLPGSPDGPLLFTP